VVAIFEADRNGPMNADDPSNERKERAKVIGLFVAVILLTLAVFAWVCLKAWGADTTIVFAALLLLFLVVGFLEGLCLAMIQVLGMCLTRLAKWVHSRSR
jgi:hypothetical protein